MMMFADIHKYGLILMFTSILTGCGGGEDASTFNPDESTVVDEAPVFSGTPDVNQAPVLSGTPDLTALVGANYTFIPGAVDNEDDSLVFSIQNKPSWLNFEATSGTLSGVPDISNIGSFADIIISVSDGLSSVALNAFSVEVVGGSQNFLPIAQPDSIATAIDTPVLVSVLLNDSGLEDGVMFVEVFSYPVNGSVSIINNEIEYTPNNSFSGSDGFVYRVTDIDGDESLANVSITVGQASRISWTANNEEDVAGYYLYHGQVSGEYDQRIWVGNNTEYVYASATSGDHYFVATAVDIYENESAFSTEVMAKL
jgi:hypothetical protein